MAILSFLLAASLYFNGNFAHNALALSSVPVFDVIQVGLFDAKGQRISEAIVGQQLSVKVSIASHLDTDQEYLALTEIRDGTGTTIYLTWQGGKLGAGGNYTFETSWMVDRSCNIDSQGCNSYDIRSFVITGIENPQVLSGVKSSGGSMIETTAEGNKLYRLEVEGELYEIEYSLDVGSIGLIQVEKERSLVHVTLRDSSINENSTFIFKASKAFLFEVLSCDIEPNTNDMGGEVEAFVDGVSYGLMDASAEEWRLELQGGSREVAFTGACFI